MGVAVTPFCDRNTVVVATSQLKFISMFLRPQLSSMEVRRRGCSCPWGLRLRNLAAVSDCRVHGDKTDSLPVHAESL